MISDDDDTEAQSEAIHLGFFISINTEETMMQSTKIKGRSVPVNLSNDVYTNEIRLLATVFLKETAELIHGSPDERRVELLHANIKAAMLMLVRRARIPGASPLNIFMDALKETRRTSKALISQHGDPLQSPEPFALAYAENVLELVEQTQRRLAGIKQLAAA